MDRKRVKTFAPASIANLCAGFDVLGVALEAPGDFVTAARSEKHILNFTMEQYTDKAPATISDNIAEFVALKMIEDLRPPFGIDMVLHKALPIGSGMGSSGASAVASAMAVNALLPKPLTKHELLPYVISGEQKASGAAHADNVGPSLLGGVCIARNAELDVISFNVSPKITWIVLSPHYVISTEESRRLLPKDISLPHVTRQMGNISGFILGLIRGDGRLIANCMQDYIAEPVRAVDVPAFYEVKQAALEMGALGAGISGSGPAIFAITLNAEQATKIAEHMKLTLHKETGLSASFYISQTNPKGATVIVEEE